MLAADGAASAVVHQYTLQECSTNISKNGSVGEWYFGLEKRYTITVIHL